MLWDLLLGLLMHVAPLTAGLGFAPGPAPVATGPAVAAAATVDSVEVGAFSPQQTQFSVRFGEAVNDRRVMAMFVLPGESVPVAVEPAAVEARYTLSDEAGEIRGNGDNAWTWTAPSRPGLHPLEIRGEGGEMTLNVFVMVPYAAMRAGSIGGYRIGNYPRTRTGFEAEYRRPRGFIEVTPELYGVQVSPHFTLGQFACKQPGDPKYLVLRQPLLVKLEELLAEVNQRGYDARTFSIMSAYRTPLYNIGIGNVTTFSRHQYGDAADIFVDTDHDGVMDDLNHDGRHTLADSHLLASIVAQTQDDPDFEGLTGGLGTYAPTHEHGPFVHVDVRGFEARWGA